MHGMKRALVLCHEMHHWMIRSCVQICLALAEILHEAKLNWSCFQSCIAFCPIKMSFIILCSINSLNAKSLWCIFDALCVVWICLVSLSDKNKAVNFSARIHAENAFWFLELDLNTLNSMKNDFAKCQSFAHSPNVLDNGEQDYDAPFLMGHFSALWILDSTSCFNVAWSAL